MKDIDFKQIALTVASVIVALAIYDRAIAPMVDKQID